MSWIFYFSLCFHVLMCAWMECAIGFIAWEKDMCGVIELEQPRVPCNTLCLCSCCGLVSEPLTPCPCTCFCCCFRFDQEPQVLMKNCQTSRAPAQSLNVWNRDSLCCSQMLHILLPHRPNLILLIFVKTDSWKIFHKKLLTASGPFH